MASNTSTRTALDRQTEKLRAVEERIRKIKLREAERLLVIAEAAGWFDAEVPDERLTAAFAHLVREAKGAAKVDGADTATPSPAPTDVAPSGTSDSTANG